MSLPVGPVGGTPKEPAASSQSATPVSTGLHVPTSDSPVIVITLAISCLFYLILSILVIAYITPYHCIVSNDKTLNDVNKNNIQYIDGLGIMLPTFLLLLFSAYEIYRFYNGKGTLLSNKAHRFLCTFYHLVILQLSLTIYTYFKDSTCDDVNGVEGTSHSVANTSLDLLMTVSAGLFMVHFIYLYWSCKE